MTKRTPSPRNKPDPPSLIIDTALALAARDGWAQLSIRDIAVAANVPIGEALAIFPSKQVILTAFRNRIDQTVVAGTELDSLDGAVRDRLFDILMRRLEVLLPWKEGVAAIARDTLRDPLASLHGITSLNRSMALMAECAGIPSSGLRGRTRIRGLTVIYLFVLRRWLNDDSTDMAPTMAELDGKLKTAEEFLQRLCPLIQGNRRKTEREKQPIIRDPT